LISQTSGQSFLQRFWVACVVALVSTALVIGGAYFLAARKVAQVPKVKMDTSVLQDGGNFLLIGSDSRAFVEQSPQDAQHFGSPQQEVGQRSDTIMVAHVDSARGTGFIVSFPRDLWVDIPGMGKAKLNAAFNAGPQRLIETIEQDFGVPISHYLQVDFAGFRNIVDAIGTIPIYFPTPARDKLSGLYINQAGCQHLNGADALAYVRSRYYEMLENGKWHSDPSSDLGRIKRQQYFLRTLAQQAVHASEHSPWKAPKILDNMLANLQRDPKLGLSALRGLAYAFHGSGTLETFTLPTHPQKINGQDALVLDDAQAGPLLARLRGVSGGGTAPPPPAGVTADSVHVAVRNGTARSGVAGSTLNALRQAGFSVLPPAINADRNDYKVTEVRYVKGAERKAQLVLAYLHGAGKSVALASAPSDAQDADVVLVVGRDFTSITKPAATSPATPAPASNTPHNAAAPPATASLPASGC
jgi:LCP family protein required for cell wall assembly